MLQAGLTDPDGLKLFAMKEGLDLAVWMEEEKSAYESVVRNILLLFGDGQTTQQIVLTPHTTRPDIQLRVLSAFMANPIMSVASPQVQDAFKNYREALIGFMRPDLACDGPESGRHGQRGRSDWSPAAGATSRDDGKWLMKRMAVLPS
jgi:hypothetical protein